MCLLIGNVSQVSDVTHGLVPYLVCAAAQQWHSWLEHSPRKWKVGCLNPSCYRPKSLKQVVTAPLPNAQQHV